ncbi:hypothetical protein Tco_0116440 [Tanacetum coccineum]
MEFLSAVFSPCYPSTNNQLRSSSNPRNQAIVQDGRFTVQQVQGRQGQNVVGSGSQGNALGSRGNTSGQAKVVKCYNYQGEGHMTRQFTQPKRRRDASWFKEKVLLVQAHAEDAYDSDCDDISSAKAILMDNLSSCDSDVLSENSMIISMFEQMSNHATNWDKANNESKIVHESLTAELERYKERVKILEQRFNVDLSSHVDDDIEEMDKKWNLALLSIRVDRSPRSQDRGKNEIYKKEEPAPKAMIAIDGIGWDCSYMAKEDENHARVADEEEYRVVHLLLHSVYSPPKKDLSWMGLPEFVDDTVTDYSRPTPSVDVSKMFVKETGCLSVSKDNNTENPRKPTVKYAEMYRNTSQSPKVRSNNFGPPIIEDWDSDDESEFETT